MQYALTPTLTVRTIDPVADADLCAANHYDACVASFGDAPRYEGRDAYLAWLKPRVDEFPEGFVLAYDRDRFVGHLELQVPYGLATGYVNLFYVAPGMRGLGYGRRLHEYAERYFQNWEADRAELHVSPRNLRAIRFYRRLGYAFTRRGHSGSYLSREARLWKMSKPVGAGTAAPGTATPNG